MVGGVLAAGVGHASTVRPDPSTLDVAGEPGSHHEGCSQLVPGCLFEVRGVPHIGPPKTRASRRTVGLPRFVADELAAHLAGPGDPEHFVFTAPQGGALRVTAFRARVWRLAIRAAGLDGLRIHDLRHTAVALWIAARANPKEVAARAGHASVSFTLDRYGHLYPEAETALRDRLDAHYGTTQPASAGTVVHLSQRPGRGPSVAPGASGDDKSAAGDAPTTL